MCTGLFVSQPILLKVSRSDSILGSHDDMMALKIYDLILVEILSSMACYYYYFYRYQRLCIFGLYGAIQMLLLLLLLLLLM